MSAPWTPTVPKRFTFLTPTTVEGDLGTFGNYRIVRLIGTGGMAFVFEGEDQTLHRPVAVKVLRPEVAADPDQCERFLREARVTAALPAEAAVTVYEIGQANGTAFMVMELLAGESLQTYLDRVERVSAAFVPRLGRQVAATLAVAHQLGVIHRDIKPGNVLVQAQDGKPAAKVIDFGIAKATDARLTDRTVYTEHRQLIGTPEYMSPEQAEGSLDIDTRTDVYSLGVLMYELLTGSTPFSGKELRSAAYGELQRVLREVDPPKPSTRLGQNAATLASVAASRRTEPLKLGRTLRGELDWIVMRAIEKNRARRYESPGALAADVQRYLAGEAVVAAPPSGAYVLSKFVRRHKGVVASVGAVAAALVVGAVGFAWQARVAEGQRRVAEAQRALAVAAEAETSRRADELQAVSDFQERMLGQVDATSAGGALMKDVLERYGKAMEKAEVGAEERAGRVATMTAELERVNATDAAAAMIDRTILKPSVAAIDAGFGDQPAVGATLRYALSMRYRGLGLYEAGIPLARAAAETRERLLGADDPATLEARTLVADLLGMVARNDEALPMLRDVLERRRRVQGEEHTDTLTAMSNLGNALRERQAFAEAEPLLRGSMEGGRRTRGSEHRDTLMSMNTYGFLLIRQGKVAETEPYWREAYETGRRVFGPDDPDVLVWAANMGGLLTEMGRFDEAAERYRDATEGFRRVLGEEHPNTLGCSASLALALRKGGKEEEAERIYRGLAEAQRRVLGDEHPDTLGTLSSLGLVLASRGLVAEGEAMLREALAAYRKTMGGGHLKTLDTMGVLAGVLLKAERHAEADALRLEQLAGMERSVGTDHFAWMTAAKWHADGLVAAGRLEEGEAWLRRVIEARLRVTGRAHPETAYALDALGNVLRERGNLAEAEEAAREAISILRTARGGDDLPLFLALDGLAEIVLRAGHPAEAEPLCREALAGMEGVPGLASRRMPRVRRTLGKVLTALGRFEEAEAALLASRAAATAQGTAGRKALRMTLEALAGLHATWDAAAPGAGHGERKVAYAAEMEGLGASNADGNRP